MQLSFVPTTTAYQRLLEANREAEVEHAHTSRVAMWSDSPFKWLLFLSNIPRADAARDMLMRWLIAEGLEAEVAPGQEKHMIVNGHRVAVKVSLQWSEGMFAFQQIRDSDYSHLLMFGLTPHQAYLWVVPKGVARQNAPNQHGEDATKWVQFTPADVPPWLRAWGGELWEGLRMARLYLGSNIPT